MKDRDQEIKDKALDKYGDSDSACAYGQRMGFKAGAKWADENPKNVMVILDEHMNHFNNVKEALSIAKETLKKIIKENQCVRKIGCPNCIAKEVLIEIEKLEN